MVYLSPACLRIGAAMHSIYTSQWGGFDRQADRSASVCQRLPIVPT
ncbi:MAG: hypothetical protein VKJ85_12825 [Prochlorothrix sp.]|nr:hypothetical protein [Prochlorothrix sp.]